MAGSSYVRLHRRHSVCRSSSFIVLYTCGLGKQWFLLAVIFLYLNVNSYMLLIHVFQYTVFRDGAVSLYVYRFSSLNCGSKGEVKRFSLHSFYPHPSSDIELSGVSLSS